jgi:hypothetical protein
MALSFDALFMQLTSVHKFLNMLVLPKEIKRGHQDRERMFLSYCTAMETSQVSWKQVDLRGPSFKFR